MNLTLNLTLIFRRLRPKNAISTRDACEYFPSGALQSNPPPWGENRAIDPPPWGRKNVVVTPAFYPRNSSSYLKRVIVTPAVYPRNSGRYPISTNLTLLLMLLRGNGRVGKNLQTILISVHHIVRFWVSGRSVKNFMQKHHYILDDCVKTVHQCSNRTLLPWVLDL